MHSVAPLPEHSVQASTECSDAKSL
eukprot:COSAG02_NODE_71420_length_191_cov_25.586957_1_plen_24_part_10